MGNLEFRMVTDKGELDEVYKLRYKVYCEEKGFESPEDHPGGVEIDKYDENSVHFIALNARRHIIGTARLILNSEKGFPIEKNSKIETDISGIERSRLGEISRLAVSKEYCRRVEDQFIYFGVSEKDSFEIPNIFHDHRRRQLIVLGLYKLIYIEGKKRGLTHWFAVMSKGLYLLLRKIGIVFRPIGPAVNYHGLRAPYLGSIAEIEAAVERVSPEFFKQAREELRRSM